MDISYSVSLCSLIFSYRYTNNALNPHNQRGFNGPRHVLHFAPLKQCALIIIMWVLHFAPLKQCALIIIMWVLLKFVLVYGFIIPSMYCILGFVQYECL